MLPWTQKCLIAQYKFVYFLVQVVLMSFSCGWTSSEVVALFVCPCHWKGLCFRHGMEF